MGGLQRKEKPFFLNGSGCVWGVSQHTDSKVWEAEIACLVLWFSQSAQDPWEESGGHPARGYPNQEHPRSMVTVPSTLTHC